MITRLLTTIELVRVTSAHSRNIPLVYGLRALLPAMALPIPTIVAFWQSHGITLGQIMVLEAIYAGACILLEVPAGFLADRYQRRRVLTFGGVNVLIGMLCYCAGESFGDFVVAELFLALGFSCISGADEALFYDTLNEKDEAHTFSKHWSWVLSLEMAMASIAFVIGSTVAAIYGLRVPFYLAAITQCGFLGITLLMHEPIRTRAARSSKYLGELVGVGVQVLGSNASSRWLILISALLFSFTQVGFWLYQPFFAECEIPLEYNGIILAVLGLFASAMALQVPRQSEKFGLPLTTSILVVLASVAFVVLGSLQTAWIIPVLLLHQVVRAFFRVLYSEQLHRHIGSEYRATSVSIKNIVCQLCYAVLLLIVSVLVENWGTANTFLALGIGVLVLGIALLRSIPKEMDTSRQ